MTTTPTPLATDKVTEPETKVDDIVDAEIVADDVNVAGPDTTVDETAVKRENAAAQAAKILGDPKPATPNLDKAKEKAAMTSTTTKDKTKAVKNSDKVRFTHDGMPMHESHMLGGVAFHYTKGLGKGGAKLTSTELGDLIYTLKDLKTGKAIKDLYEPGYEVELPNGIKIGTIKPSEVDKYRKAAKAAGVRSSTSPKATPAKATGVTKKATGKTTGASKPTTAKAPAKKAGSTSKRARAAEVKAANSSKTVTPLPKAKDAAKVKAATA